MTRYPPAAKRDYDTIISYRGYSIALYRSKEACFTYGEMPIYDLYFVLDEITGDNVLPVDVPLGSVFLCYAAIDLYSFIDQNPWWKKKYASMPIWDFIHRNSRLERHVGEVMNFLLDFRKEIDEYDPDFGQEIEEWKKSLMVRLDTFHGTIHGWWKPKIMETPDAN